MKNPITLPVTFLFFFGLKSFSQSVGIGTTTPAPTAVLDISSTTMGLLAPRLTAVQRDAITNPANGLIIFNTTNNSLEFRDSIDKQWIDVSPTVNTVQTASPTGKLMVVYTKADAYGFYQNSIGTGFWLPQALGGTVIGLKSALNMIALYTGTYAYGFSQSSIGAWTSQALSGTPLGIIACGNSIVVYTSTTAYGFTITSTSADGYWLSQSLSGQLVGYGTSGQSIVVYTSKNAYALSQNTTGAAFWTAQTLDSSPLGSINSH